jgi:hypothetical protein
VGEVLDPLQKFGVVREWINASERLLGVLPRVCVPSAGCSVQVALWLAGENVLYVVR